MVVMASRVRAAVTRFSAFDTLTTKPTTARVVRREARSWPTAASRACSERTGRARSKNWKRSSGAEVVTGLSPRFEPDFTQVSRCSALRGGRLHDLRDTPDA